MKLTATLTGKTILIVTHDVDLIDIVERAISFNIGVSHGKQSIKRVNYLF